MLERLLIFSVPEADVSDGSSDNDLYAADFREGSYIWVGNRPDRPWCFAAATAYQREG